MSQSISVILPACNIQQSLAQQVADVLEVLPEMSSQFEVIIVDDCSADDTEEVAYELSRQFPQVQMVRHRQQRGRQAAVQSGMEMSQGDVIFVKEDGVPLRSSEMKQLWEMREDPELVMARATPRDPEPLNPRLLQELMEWGAAIESEASKTGGGIQMIRRRAIESESIEDRPMPVMDDRQDRQDRPLRGPSRTDQVTRRMPPVFRTP